MQQHTSRIGYLKGCYMRCFAFSYIRECLVYMYIQAVLMKTSQIEVSNIRFGKLEDNIRTPSQNIAFIY